MCKDHLTLSPEGVVSYDTQNSICVVTAEKCNNDVLWGTAHDIYRNIFLLIDGTPLIQK